MTDLWEDLIRRYEHDGNCREILGEVLAILNGDGGHYQELHGTAEAVFRGIKRFHEQRRIESKV